MTNTDLEQVLQEGIVARTKLNDALVSIIAASDSRMEATNKMVDKLSSTLHTCVEEYSHHLDSLKSCREELQRIIQAQQDTIRLLQEDLRKERERNNEIIDKVLLRPNINVRQ